MCDFIYLIFIYEEKILGAEDKILSLEQQMYQDLLDQVFTEMGAIQNNGQLIGTLDCLLCFAQIAKENKYCKPSLIHIWKLGC